MNPYEPGGGGGYIYYRIKVYNPSSNETTYSYINSATLVSPQCSGLPSTIANPLVYNLQVNTLSSNIKLTWNSSCANCSIAVGGLVNYEIDYYGVLGSTVIAHQFVTSTSNFYTLPYATGPYSGNGYVTFRVRSVWENGDKSPWVSKTRNMTNGSWTGGLIDP